MSVTVNLDKEFVSVARSYSAVESRSVSKQIEHWATIGRIVEENPDLTYHDVKEILLGYEDFKDGNVSEYHRGNL
jgi:hypothetical protein